MAMVRQGSSISIDSLIQQFHGLSCYFPNFGSTKEVAKYIKRRADVQSGSYLVRPSFSNQSCHSISVLVPDGSVRHAKILTEYKDDQLFFHLVPEIKFNSLQSLLDYYSQNAVYNLEGVEEVKFLRPIYRDNFSSGNSTNSRSDPLHDLPGFIPNSQVAIFHSDNVNGQQFQVSGQYLSSNHGTGHSLEPVETIPPLTAKEEHSTKEKRDKKKMQSLNNAIKETERRPPLPARNDLQRPNSGPFPINNDNVSPLGDDDSQNCMPFKVMSLPRNNYLSNIPLDNRPPAPLPQRRCIQSTSAESPYYSRPRDPKMDMTEDLKRALKMSDICECGLPRELSDLPAGWTIHRSKDELTMNKGFFQSPSGQTTWSLPLEILKKLTAIQKGSLRRLELMFGPKFIREDIWEEPQFPLVQSARSESNLLPRGPTRDMPHLLSKTDDQINTTHF